MLRPNLQQKKASVYLTSSAEIYFQTSIFKHNELPQIKLEEFVLLSSMDYLNYCAENCAKDQSNYSRNMSFREELGTTRNDM